MPSLGASPDPSRIHLTLEERPDLRSAGGSLIERERDWRSRGLERTYVEASLWAPGADQVELADRPLNKRDSIIATSLAGDRQRYRGLLEETRWSLAGFLERVAAYKTGL